MPNRVNSDLLKDFLQHIRDNGTSENYQKGNFHAQLARAEVGEMVEIFSVYRVKDAGLFVLMRQKDLQGRCGCIFN
jgi:hypothetical protein